MRFIQNLESTSVSTRPKPSSEVSFAAIKDGKDSLLYKFPSGRQPARIADQSSRRGQENRMNMFVDSYLKSRVSPDDSEAEMQPGIWGKRSESHREDAMSLETSIGFWGTKKNSGKWGRQAHRGGQRAQMSSEVASKRANPGMWGKRAEKQDKTGGWELGTAIIRRVLQDIEENRRRQKNMLLALNVLMRNEGCKESETKKRGQRRQSVPRLVKAMVTGSDESLARRIPSSEALYAQ